MQSQNYPRIANPMTIIALFVGLTEIGFGIASSKIPANLQIYFIVFLILFPTLCAIGFFVVLYFRPHHFYGPSDFRNDESYLAIVERIKKMQSSIAVTNDKKAEVDTYYRNREILSQIINRLDESVCWFFLKGRGKALTFMELVAILGREQGNDLNNDRIGALVNTLGVVSYMRCLGSIYLNVIYRLLKQPDEKLMLEISDETLKLINHRLSLD